MKLATVLSLPLNFPRSSSTSPQSLKSKEAITAYSAKFQEFSKDIKTFVKVIEEAKKNTVKCEASYQQIIAQTNAWTRSLSNESMNQEEISQLELTLREKLIDFEKDYDEEIVKQARKFKISMLTELHKALKNTREAWSGVGHYENKVKNLKNKLERADGSPQKVEDLEEKLGRNEKKLLQSITIASQWDKELKRCSSRMDQAWITAMTILKDFTEFEMRNSSEVRKVKNKIEELIVEDASYAQDKKMKEPLSIVVDEIQRSPLKGNSSISAMTIATVAASVESGGFVLPFKKKNKKRQVEEKVLPEPEPVPSSIREEADDNDIIEYDESMDSYFGKMESSPAPSTEESSVDDEVYIVEEAQKPEEDYTTDLGEVKEPQEDEITV